MKVVTPFRGFPAESAAHKKLGPFDWPAAISMLRTSVRRSCHCETYVITDIDETTITTPAYRYATVERRLMLWLLEICLAYLSSSDFDDDTAMISPDALVYRDLRPFFRADIGVVVRIADKFVGGRQILNAVQFWNLEGKDRLIRFYRDALAIGRTLPDSSVRWGADTIPLLQLLAPIAAGTNRRNGLTYYGWSRDQVFRGVTAFEASQIKYGRPLDLPTVPVIDFKYLTKRLMAQYFSATYGHAVSA
jgi:hypothetical protein